MAVLIALSRTSTNKELAVCKFQLHPMEELTAAAIANNPIQDGHKVGDDMVHFV